MCGSQFCKCNILPHEDHIMRVWRGKKKKKTKLVKKERQFRD
jgi:hypothetical protein